MLQCVLHSYSSVVSLQGSPKLAPLSARLFLTSVCVRLFAGTVEQSGLAGAALLMPQADYFSTVITLLSPLCRSGLWGLMDTAMYNSLIISIQFDN